MSPVEHLDHLLECQGDDNAAHDDEDLSQKLAPAVNRLWLVDEFQLSSLNGRSGYMRPTLVIMQIITGIKFCSDGDADIVFRRPVRSTNNLGSIKGSCYET
jgi:hypothetical protein